MATRAGDVTVTPTASVWTQFDVTDVDGKVRIAAKKGDVTVDDGAGPTLLAQGQETTRDQSNRDQSEPQEKKKKKKKSGGAAPAGAGGVMDSPLAVGIGVAAVAGVTTWVLVKGDEPVSPVKP
jgi:hypothetical protein